MAEEDEKVDKDSAKETASLNKRLKKHEGDAMALAAELSAENADLNRQLNAAKGNKPKEGSLILTPEQAKQWETFIALGKPEDVVTTYQAYVAHGTPDEIKTKLEANVTLEKENTALKNTEKLRQVADAGVTIDGKHSKLNVEVLSLIDSSVGGLVFEDRDVTVDGKTQKVPHVKVDNKFMLFSEYLKTKHAVLLPSLINSTSSAGTPVISQTADDKQPPKTPDVGQEFFKKVQEARDKKPNPLAA